MEGYRSQGDSELQNISDLDWKTSRKLISKWVFIILWFLCCCNLHTAVRLTLFYSCTGWSFERVKEGRHVERKNILLFYVLFYKKDTGTFCLLPNLSNIANMIDKYGTLSIQLWRFRRSSPFKRNAQWDQESVYCIVVKLFVQYTVNKVPCNQ